MAPPVIPVKTYDMASSNAWGNLLGNGSEHRDAAEEI